MTAALSGNVGIGTATPGAGLDIIGDTNPDLRIKATGVSSNAILRFVSRLSGVDKAASITTDWNGNFVLSPTGGQLALATVNGGGATMSVGGSLAVGASYNIAYPPANGMVVQGNVGIGTTNPGQVFQVVNPNDTAATANFGRDGDWNLGINRGGLQWSAGGREFAFDSNFPYRFKVGGTSIMWLASGSVGIGTTAPGANFVVQADSSAYPGKISIERINGSVPFTAATVGTGLGFTDYGGGTKIGGIYVSNSGLLTVQNNFGTSISLSNPYVHISQANISSAGSLAAPALSLDSTSGSEAGLYRPTSSSIGFVTSRLERMRIDSAGNVGIGTTNPQDKFQVVGAAADKLLSFSAGLTVEAANSSTPVLVVNSKGAADIQRWQYNGTPTARITATGDIVGGSLQVQSAVGTLAAIHSGIKTVGMNSDWSVKWSNGTSNFFAGTTDVGLSRVSAGVLEVNNGTAGNPHDLNLRALNPAGGNVGIGTTAPTGLLDVITGANGAAFKITSSNITYRAAPGGTDNIWDNNGLALGVSAGQNYRLYVNGTGRISDRLYLGSSIDFTTAGGEAAKIASPASDVLTVANSGGERMRVTNIGNVGIGTTGPAVKLDVVGSAKFGQSDANNYASFGISGGLTINTSTSNVVLGVYNGGTSGLSVAPNLGKLTMNAVGLASGLSYNGMVADGATAELFSVNSYNSLANASSKLLAVRNAGSEKLTVLGNGNVGMGTTNPGAKLEVISNTNAIGLNVKSSTGHNAFTHSFENSGQSRVTLYSTNGGSAARALLYSYGTSFINPETFSTNGGLSIGTGNTSSYGLYVAHPSFGAGTAYFAGGTHFGGDVGIGTTVPTAPLHIAGENFPLSTQYDAKLNISGNENAYAVSFLDAKSTSITMATGAWQFIQTRNMSAVATGFGPTLMFQGYRWDGTNNVQNLAGDKLGQISFRSSTAGSYQNTANIAVTSPTGTDALMSFHIKANSGVTTGFGTAKMVLTSDGNVGIGTAAPSANLHISGSGSTFRLERSNGGQGLFGEMDFKTPSASTRIASVELSVYNAALAFYTDGDGVQNNNNLFERMRIDYNGNVGIGTTTPGTTLEVGGNYVTGKGNLYINSASRQHSYIAINADANKEAGVQFQAAGATKWWLYRANDGTNDLRIDSFDASTVMTIKESNGNIGIGTTTPGGKLEIQSAEVANRDTGATPFALTTATGTRAKMIYDSGAFRFRMYGPNETSYSQIETSNSAITFRSPANFTLQSASGNVQIQAGDYFVETGGLERMRINSLGNVGIGTTAPATILYISGDFDGTGATTDPAVSNKGVTIAKRSGIASDWSVGDTFGVTFTSAANGGDYNIAGIYAEPSSAYNYVGGNLHFVTHDDTNANMVKRMTITALGNVGIGTTLPSSALVIAGDTGGLPLVSIVNNANRGITIRPQSDGFGAGGARFDLVGPAASFLFAGDVVPTSSVSKNLGNSGDNWLNVYTQNVRGRNNSSNGDLNLRSGHASVPLTLGLESMEYMRIHSGGNVGIGTSVPDQKLSIAAGNVGFEINYGLSWDSDTEYIKRVGSDTLALATQSTQRLTILGVGNVGVADTSPDALLEVSAGGGTGDLLMLSSNHNNDGDRFIVKNNGNVGIGTTNPSAKLDVAGSIQGQGSVSFATAGLSGTQSTFDFTNSGMGNSLFTIRNASTAYTSSYGLTLETNGGSNYMRSGAYSDLYLRGGLYAGKIAFGMGSIDLMTILNSGNVGIGTTAPLSALDLSGAGTGDVLRLSSPPSDNSTLSSIVWAVSGQTNYRSKISVISPAGSTFAMAFFTGGGEVMRLAPQGPGSGVTSYVGIGTAVPTATVEINGNLKVALNTNSFLGSLRFIGNSGLNTIHNIGGTGINITDSSYVSLGRVSQHDLYVSGVNGNVGIGTTTPNSKMVVSGGGLIVKNNDVYWGVNGTPSAGSAVVQGNLYLGSSPNASEPSGAALTGAPDGTYGAIFSNPNIAGSFVFKPANSNMNAGFAALNGTGARALSVAQHNGYGISGRVGVGDISSNATGYAGALTVQNSYGASIPTLVIRNQASQTADSLQIRSSSDVSLVVISGAGNVGIGTTSPTRRLHTMGSVMFEGNSVEFGVTSAPVFALSNNSSGYIQVGGGNQNGVELYHHTTRVARFRNTNSFIEIGNVGIALSAPHFTSV